MTRRGWVLFRAMCLLWGLPYLLITIAVEVLAPSSLVLLRTGLAAMVLVPWAVARGQLLPALRAWDSGWPASPHWSASTSRAARRGQSCWSGSS